MHNQFPSVVNFFPGKIVVIFNSGNNPAADDLRLSAGDTLVISGLPAQLALVEKRLLKG